MAKSKTRQARNSRGPYKKTQALSNTIIDIRLLREEAVQREDIRLVARRWDAALAGAKGAA